jgi:hypothetical protein
MKLFTPTEIQYQPMNIPAVQTWLSSRGSQEADPTLLAELDSVAKRWNVNPLLLLAITGAEQSFVPARDNPAELSNPWNVTGGSGPG